MARRNIVLGAALAAGIWACGPAAAAPAEPGPLHVPSPDWRDQVIYFAMIDRFDDGDPGNDDQRTGEYDPAQGSHFSGGDLAGLRKRLDYIQGLGATTLWITPPVANQWWNRTVQYGGYHGYWASDFSRIDAHFGDLADYQALSRDLHARGMYLVQDVVVNHVGDWFRYATPPEDPAVGQQRVRDTQGADAPARWPFSENDPRDPAQRALGVYHWTPDIRDYTDPVQEHDWQLAGLDDLDTGNPLVRHALRKAYGEWIRAAGVDGFRIDTAFYVAPDYFADFLHADDPDAPGIARVAAATGRDDFLAFGEGFAIDPPFADDAARKIDGYMRAPGGLRSMINFPLYGSLGDVFARGRAPAVLAHRIDSMLDLHADPWRMPSFVDNHDVERFLAGGDAAGLRQALFAMLTLPGIPVVYYGTEQGFRGQRDAMFAGGHGSGGRDHFDTGAPMYRWLQGAIALRRDNPVFSRGRPTVLVASAAGPGPIAWRTDHGDAHALVAINSADGDALLDNLDTGLPEGTPLEPLFAIEGDAPALLVGPGGRVDLVLPERGGFAWRAGPPAGGRPGTAAEDPAKPTLQAPAAGPLKGDLELRGTAAPRERLQLVVDGDLAAAMPVQADAHGHWQALIATGDMVDPSVEHRVVAWTGRVASAPHVFRVERDWVTLASVEDPSGDDHGPAGTYVYPLGAGWRDQRPGDLLGLRAWGSGGALRLQLQLPSLSTAWNPANGFDHVAFTVFVELPGRDGGVAAMPLQHDSLPGGMRWHLRLRAHGWSNAAFASKGASAASEGTPLPGAAHLDTDAEAGTVTFTLPARLLGNPATLEGARVFVNTWDYDAGYRPLAEAAGNAHFGGGDGSRDPLWLDAIGPVSLRAAR